MPNAQNTCRVLPILSYLDQEVHLFGLSYIQKNIEKICENNSFGRMLADFLYNREGQIKRMPLFQEGEQ
jgi:hypothetical protein